MSLPLYLDHNIPTTVALGLRGRGVEVRTAFEDGLAEADDETLLARAISLGCLLVSLDRDFRRVAAAYQREGRHFVGIATVRSDAPVGPVIADLEIVATAGREGELSGQVLYIPF